MTLTMTHTQIALSVFSLSCYLFAAYKFGRVSALKESVKALDKLIAQVKAAR